MSGSDDYVAVAPDGAGKAIRTRKVNVLLDDGTFESMEVQAVVLVDAQGTVIALDLLGTLKGIREELQRLREFLALHIG